jgi:uncharacterized delta-60 repeat protein
MWIENINSSKWEKQQESLNKEVFDFLRKELKSVRFYSKCLDGTSYLSIDNLDNIYPVLDYTNQNSWYNNGTYSLSALGDIEINTTTIDSFHNSLIEYGFTLKNLFTPKRTIDDQLINFLKVDLATTQSLNNITSKKLEFFIDSNRVINGHRILVKDQKTTVVLANNIDPDNYFIGNYTIEEVGATTTTYSYYNEENGIYIFNDGVLTKSQELSSYEDTHKYSVYVKLGTVNKEKQYHLSRLLSGYYPIEGQPFEFIEKKNWLLRNVVEYNNVVDVNYRGVLYHDDINNNIPKRTIAVGDFGQITIEQNGYLGIIKNQYKLDLNDISENNDYYWCVGEKECLLKINKIDLSVEKIEGFDDLWNFNKIKFITNTRGVIIGEGGLIYYTTNGGKKWSQIKLTNIIGTKSLYDLLWWDLSTLYIVGEEGIFIRLIWNDTNWDIEKITLKKQINEFDEYIILDSVLSITRLNTQSWNLSFNYSTSETITSNKDGLLLSTESGEIYVYDKTGFISNWDFLVLNTGENVQIKKTFFDGVSKISYLSDKNVSEFSLNNWALLDENTNIINGSVSVTSIISDEYNMAYDIEGDFTDVKLVGDFGVFEGWNGSIIDLDPTFFSKQKSRLVFLDYDMGSKLNFFNSDLEYRLPESTTFTATQSLEITNKENYYNWWNYYTDVNRVFIYNELPITSNEVLISSKFELGSTVSGTISTITNKREDCINLMPTILGTGSITEPDDIYDLYIYDNLLILNSEIEAEIGDVIRIESDVISDNFVVNRIEDLPSEIGFNNSVATIAIQSDDKVIIGGRFTTYNGLSFNSIIRLNKNGSIDNTFNIGTGFNERVGAIAIQSDGKILVGGRFTIYNNYTCNGIIRLNSDGSVDMSFVMGNGFLGHIGPLDIKIQSDGKILVGGFFTSYNSSTYNGIIRLNSDGSIDNTFNIGTGFNGIVATIAIQSDGKILVGGSFTSYNSSTYNRIIRLNSDGSVDGTFVITTVFPAINGFNNSVTKIEVLSDGKILVGGSFTTYKTSTRNRFIKLEPDGTIFIGSFSGFDDGSVSDFFVQSDGKIVVVGSFTSHTYTLVPITTLSNRIIRLNSSLEADTTFIVGDGFYQSVNAVYLDSDNDVYVGGGFTSYDNITYNRFVKLNSVGTPYYSQVKNTYYYMYGNFNETISNDLISTTSSITYRNLNKSNVLLEDFNTHPISRGYALNNNTITALFNNETAYYNMESLILTDVGTYSMNYVENFLSFGYTPQYNLLDYLSNINSVFTEDKEFLSIPHFIDIPEGNASLVVSDNRLSFHPSLKFHWDSILENTYYDIEVNNLPDQELSEKLLVYKKYISDSGRYIIEFTGKIKTPTSGIDTISILGRRKLSQISSDLQELNNITKPQRDKIFAQYNFKDLSRTLSFKFNTDSYAKVLLSDGDIKKYITGIVYTDYKYEIALNIINLETDIILDYTQVIDNGGDAEFILSSDNILNVGDRILIKSFDDEYTSYQTITGTSSNSITTDMNFTINGTGSIIFQKFDPYLNYRPSDIIDVGISADSKVGIELFDKNIDGNSLVNIDFRKEKFRFINGLNLNIVKEQFQWLLEAEIREAYIGINGNRLEWFDGVWVCGRWFDSDWYSGQWRSGEWYGGNWNSVTTVVDSISGKIGDKTVDNSKSIWYSGNHHLGVWNGGSWNKGRWITGTWNGGIWNDGSWDTGIWNGGSWNGGVWINGSWNGGVFNTDNTQSYWLDGDWNSGDFESGIWYNGTFNQKPGSISRFGIRPTNFRKAIWESGVWNGGEFHSFINYGKDRETLPSKVENHKLSIWKTGSWNGGSFWGGTTYQINWNGGKWRNGISNFIDIKGLDSTDDKIILEGVYRFNPDTTFWVIDDNIGNTYSVIGSNETPQKYSIRSIEVYEDLNKTEIKTYENISVSTSYPTNTGVKIVSNFDKIVWENGVFINGRFKGDFLGGIWLNGVFIGGSFGS